MRVLLAAPVPPPDHGGIANWTRIIRAEVGKRTDVDLCVLDTSVRWRSAVNQSIPTRLIGGSVQALRDAIKAKRHFSRDSVDVFHLCSSGGLASPKDLLTLRLARAYRVPSVIHYRMGRLPDVINFGCSEWKLIRAAVRLADKVIVLDQHSEDCLRQAAPKADVVRLANMVEIEAIDYARGWKQCQMTTDRVKRIAYIGQVLPSKGLRELVSACSRIADGRLRLELIGPVSTSFRAELINLSKLSSVRGWLTFHGPTSHNDAIKNLAASDIFVLPSYSEGFPNAVLEAMVCERPIIATTVGAIPEILDLGGQEECGVGVPPRDVEALTKALQRLLANHSLRCDLATRARRRAINLYAAPVITGKLVEIWREMDSK